MRTKVEKEIRTDLKGMLFCKAFIDEETGDCELVTRDGKKQDTISLGLFLTKIYGKPVMVTVIN